MSTFLDTAIIQFQYYKELAERTFDQLSDDQLFHQFDSESNSISIIVNHLQGNMLSRWTNFLTSDGEKEWRNRDQEFVEKYNSREEMIMGWKQGWGCLFAAIEEAASAVEGQLVYIRNQGHTIEEAVARQLCHYSYHVGQIVFIGTMIKGKDWTSLSIPKQRSQSYNEKILKEGKRKEHFTNNK